MNRLNETPEPGEDLQKYASERQHAMAFNQWVSMNYGTCDHFRLLFHVANEVTPSTIDKLAQTIDLNQKMAEGLKAGVPDYVYPRARGKYHSLYLELKKFNGILSKSQRRWQRLLYPQGMCHVVVKGWEAAVKALCAYENLGPFKVDGKEFPATLSPNILLTTEADLHRPPLWVQQAEQEAEKQKKP